ncbi:MAG: Uma2 family endonuclease [Tepidisphaeraceae bacterium]|jgi:Uma2 family endonuclease
MRRHMQTELNSGDKMTRAEFHRVYKKMPEDFKAELIGGIVYVASPLSYGHGKAHVSLGMVLGTYEVNTPGVDAGDNATVLLGEDSEPQPDLYLRILPEYGGQSRTNREDYIEGAPELIVEVANSSRAVDLHAKRADYARFGVMEYLVVSLKDDQVHWFDLRSNKPLKADSNGIIRAKTFPGLWLDTRSVLARNLKKMLQVLNEGIASPEHAEFVKSLAARRK